ncbi:MAG: hypothetical protein JWM96_1253, partial [Alphaproteobacteria bacterium]|nr:hypothetical protein [Alphaproteobacteria bacterium]
MQREAEGFFKSQNLQLKYQLFLPQGDGPFPLDFIIPGFNGNEETEYTRKTVAAHKEANIAACVLNLTEGKYIPSRVSGQPPLYKMATRHLIPSKSQRIIGDGVKYILEDERIDKENVVACVMSYAVLAT